MMSETPGSVSASIPEPAVDPTVQSDGNTFGELQHSVSELLRVLYVRRWMFFLPFCAATTGAFILSLNVPRRYMATTTFERRDDPVLINLPPDEGTRPFEMLRRTLIQDVTNRDMLAEVAAKLAANDGPDRQSETSSEGRAVAEVEHLASGLSVVLKEESDHHDVIEIRYTSKDPDNIRSTLDAVRDAYIAHARSRITELLRTTMTYFRSEATKRRNVVNSLEHDLERFKFEHAGLDPLNPDKSAGELNTLRAELVAFNRKAKDLSARIEGKQEMLVRYAPPSEPTIEANQAAALEVRRSYRSPEQTRLQSELAKIDANIEQLRTVRGMTGLHPEMAALARERAAAARTLERQVRIDAESAKFVEARGIAPAVSRPRVVDPYAVVRSQVEFEIRMLEREFRDNRDEANNSAARIAEIEVLRDDALANHSRFAARDAEVTAARGDLAVYNEHLGRLARVLSAEHSQHGVLFERIRPASGGRVPESPRAASVFVLAGLAGLVAGVVLVLLRELFDQTVRTRDQIAAGLGIPILESIDEIVCGAGQRKRLLLRSALGIGAACALLVAVGLSGSAAYLSLQDRGLYDQLMALPRSVISGLGEVQEAERGSAGMRVALREDGK